ncbi:MAG: potassium channel family protein [Dehalococcoidia bacterium]|nr:potassium channel family protein [Dehalococcoidia bacterium]
MQSEDRLRDIERATEVPLLVLALAMVPLLLGPVMFKLRSDAGDLFLAMDWLIWAAFATDFGVKLAVAPRRLEYVRTHPLEVGMVVLPFLRPLRLARLIRFARVGTALGLNVTILQRLAAERGTRLVVGAVLSCLIVGAGGVLLAERGESEANITSFGDALWWAATTMTTVGYGDRFPTTAEGRGIAIVLMLFGIAALSALTAVVAAMLVREHAAEEEEPKMSELLDELRQLRREVAEMRREAN